MALKHESLPLRARIGRIRVSGRRESRGLLLLTPPILWLLAFFVVPVLFVAAYSVSAIALFPGDTIAPTWANWHDFLTGSTYLDLFWKSVRMSITVSLFVVVLAYPLAYYLAFLAGRHKYVLLLVLMAPFLTSYLLRVLAWKVILGDQGVINTFAYWTGLRPSGHPIPFLLYSQFTVILVLIYAWVPWATLPIFVSLEHLDRRLLEAASDLGASRWRSFRSITLPLSTPGVIAGFLFVFIPTIGEFVAPSLVGGANGYMFGNAIQDMFGPGLDWQTGSVLAIFLIVVVGSLAALFSRYLKVSTVATD